jgi:MFS family permease
VGRRAFFFAGPAVNVLAGLMIYGNPRSIPLLMLSRLIKMARPASHASPLQPSPLAWGEGRAGAIELRSETREHRCGWAGGGGQVFGTFASTVMCTAALMDTCSGAELSGALTQMGAFGGAAVVVGPLLESTLLRRSGDDLRYPFLLLAVEGALHVLVNLALLPETLPKARRAPPMTARRVVAALNPFGFLSAPPGAHAQPALGTKAPRPGPEGP